MQRPVLNVPSAPPPPAFAFLQRVWHLNHALEQVSVAMFSRSGVTAPQRFLLRCIAESSGVTAGQLAALLHVDPGTVSASLKRLEGKGLVTRRRDRRDARRVCLELTKAGRALVRPGDGTVEAAVVRLLAETRPGEVANASALLSRLAALLGEESARGTAQR